MSQELQSTVSLGSFLNEGMPSRGLAAEARANRRLRLGRRGVVLGCGGAVTCVGVAVLLGWMMDYEVLKAVVPGHISMKVNAALCFMIAGLGLITATAERPRWRVFSTLCAALVLVIAGATLVEYVAGINLDIDELFIGDPAQLIFPGRMAHITAINFSLTAIAMFLLQGPPLARRLAEGISLAIFIAAYAAILGFLYGVPILFGSSGYTSMALHTGIGFLVLAGGMLVAPKESILGNLLATQQRGGLVARRALPAVLLLPPLLGWLYLRRSLSFGSPEFSMALFAVTLVVCGTGTLYMLASFFNREDLQLAELEQIRERSTAAIRQSEQELLLITDQLPALLSYIDPEGRFVRVNRTYEEWIGRPAREIVGVTIRELLGETYWQSTDVARELVAAGKNVTFETIYPSRNGDRRVQVTYAPDLREDGTLQGIACLVLDVHERHQAEAALRQSEKLAAVGRLASSIAHEINNPLEAVTNLLYLAEQDTGSAYVAQAQQELARVTHIVTQTLRFHRQSAGPVLCTVCSLVDQVLMLYHSKLEQGGVIVSRRSRESKAIRCRDGEVRQVLANFIGNAADAMKQGGSLFIRTATAVHPQTGARGVRVTIADTGHGIGEVTRRTLFEPFHTTKGATGSGLGLWISKDLVQRHQGSIRVRSSTALGQSGTVFQIFFSDLSSAEGGNGLPG